VKRSCKPCFIGSQNQSNPPFAGACLDAALSGQLAELSSSRSCTSLVLVCLVLYRDHRVGDGVLLQLFL
jgi:hypothetical protein